MEPKMAELAKMILLYGRAGLGKTWTCAELVKNPACGDVFFFDLDGGLQTIRKADGSLPEHVHAGPFLDSMVACKTQWDAVKRRTGIPAEVQTLVIDSISALDQLVIAELQGHDSPHSTGEMNIPKWGKRGMLLLDYARLARSLPYKYVIFTAHQDTERDADGKVEGVYPLAGSKSTLEKFLGLFSHVIQLTATMSGQRQLIVNGTGVVTAKCRSQAVNALAPKGLCEKPLHEIIHLM